MTATTTAPASNGAGATTTLTAPKPEKLVVHDSGPAAYLFDTARFEHCYRIATAMAKASLIPEHLTMVGPKNAKRELPFDAIVGNCFMIVNQAVRWGMDPFALPAETYVVGNKLGFQGKLVAAVINARAGLSAPLSVIYNSGKNDDLAAVVFGSRSAVPREAWPLLKKYAKDESGEAYADLMEMGVLCIRVSVGQAKTDNPMWKSDPQQKLFYTGSTKWARRHAPEIILGVLTDDDMERMNAAGVGAVDVQQVRNLDQLTERLEHPAMTHVVEAETVTKPIITADPETEPLAFCNQMEAAMGACATAEEIDAIEAELLGRGLKEEVAAEVGMTAARIKERLSKSA